MDDDDRLTLTPEEAEQISHLTKQLGAKFGEIMQELANQYGLGVVVETDPGVDAKCGRGGRLAAVSLRGKAHNQ